MGSCWMSPGDQPESSIHSDESSTHSAVDWSENEDEDAFVKVYLKTRSDVVSFSTPTDELGSNNTGLTSMPPSVGMHELHATQVLELSLEPPKGKKYYRGPVVVDILQNHYVRLIDEIDPERVAMYLYNLGIIGKNEMEAAINKYNDRRNRSNILMIDLFRKLNSNPDWGDDAIVALKKAGVNMDSIIKELEELSSKSEPGPASAHASKGASTNSSLHVLKEDDILDTSILEQPNLRKEEVLKFEQREHETLPNLDPYEKFDECTTIPEEEESQQPRHCQDSSSAVLEDTGALSAQSLTGQEQDENGNTRLHLAVENLDMETVRMLVKSDCAKSIINIPNNEGQTALHVSTIKQLPLITEELLKCDDCDPYLFDKNKKTPLHYACSSGKKDLVKPILSSKRCSSECVNAHDDMGDSALHIATRSGCRSVVKLLRKNKAKPLQKNHKGETPIDIAQQSGNAELMVSLQSRGIQLWRKAKVKLPLKRSASFSVPRVSSETSVVSASQSEFNY